VGHPADSNRLEQALSATMRTVFPTLRAPVEWLIDGTIVQYASWPGLTVSDLKPRSSRLAFD
jgi:hypothetical protein